MFKGGGEYSGIISVFDRGWGSFERTKYLEKNGRFTRLPLIFLSCTIIAILHNFQPSINKHGNHQHRILRYFSLRPKSHVPPN